MAHTNRDYAPKQYLDPVSEVEREALDKGFTKGVVFTTGVLAATFLVCDVLVAFVRWALS